MSKNLFAKHTYLLLFYTPKYVYGLKNINSLWYDNARNFEETQNLNNNYD